MIIGGSVMAIGHFMMTFEPLFYVALATIALGNGLFLPSLPSQINDLYRADDPRRGRAYNVYYVGLNHRRIHGAADLRNAGRDVRLALRLRRGRHRHVRRAHDLSRRWPLPAAGGFAARSAAANAAPPRAAANQRQLWLLLLGVGIAATIFRGAYEQIGNTIPLWTDLGVDRAWGGWIIPMTWFQSLNPLLVITMTPLLLLHWRRRADAGRDTSPARKMAIGALIVAAAYLLLAMVATVVGAERANWIWLLVFFIVLTLGELYILPTGLGLFARLAPQRLGATTVAAWFLAIFSGSLLAGAVGALWSRASHAGFFIFLSGLAVAAAILLWLLDRPIRILEASRSAASRDAPSAGDDDRFAARTAQIG